VDDVRVVIYDCDGVLFDSRKANEAFYNHILERFGLPPLREEQLDFVHVSTAREAVEHLFDSHPAKMEALDYLNKMDYSPFVPLMQPEPHIYEVLSALKGHRHVAVATNRSRSMPLVLRFHKMEGFFDFVVTTLDVREPKPHPECITKIIEHFHVRPSQACYVGDAEVDRVVSERSGVHFVAYKNPTLEGEHHIDDHRELLGILGINPCHRGGR
jgi:beta-phosphoglucomutase-like phosphatase (HAD superfamily)